MTQQRIEELIASGIDHRSAVKTAEIEERIAAGEFDGLDAPAPKTRALKAEPVDPNWEQVTPCDCADCTATRKKEAAAAKRRAKKASSGAQ